MMLAHDHGAATPVRYTLTPRLSTEGRVSITLRLYRGDTIAHTRPLATVDRKQAAEVMLKCHRHLGRLGIDGMPKSGS